MPSTIPFAANLPASVSVASVASVAYAYGLSMGASNGTVPLGGFLNTTGYAGFVFGDDSTPGSLLGTWAPFFGWAKLRVDIDFTPGSHSAKLAIFEWAFEDSGAPIHIEGIPAPATPLLALLGLGAMGMQRYPRRRDEGLKRLAEESAAEAD